MSELNLTLLTLLPLRVLNPGGRDHNFFDEGVCDRGTTKNATRWAHEHIGDPKLQCYRPCHGFRRHLDE